MTTWILIVILNRPATVPVAPQMQAPEMASDRSMRPLSHAMVESWRREVAAHNAEESKR